MKVLQINTVYPNGSTGKIAKGIKELCDKSGIECKIAYRYREKDAKFEQQITIRIAPFGAIWFTCPKKRIKNR